MAERQSEEERAEQRRRMIEDLGSELRDAVRSGDVEELKKIVNECPVENGERGELLNSLLHGQRTMLHFAVENKQVPVIKWLLSEREGEGRHSGFTRVLDKSLIGNETALHIALKRGFFDGFLAIANGLRIDNGEGEEMLNAVDQGDCTLLHTAAGCNQVPIINWLLSEKAGEGRSCGFKMVLAKTSHTPLNALHIAVEKGHVEAFHAIVNGCRVDNGERQEMLNDVTSNNHTILHIAAEKKQLSIISWLLSEEGGRAAGFNFVATNNGGETALHVAASKCLETFLAVINALRVDNGERQEMLNAVNNDGRTILHKAAQLGREETVHWILSEEGGRAAGFDGVLSRNDDGETALHLAAKLNAQEHFLAVISGLRVDNGERQEMLNAVDDKGRTVLHTAARSGCGDIIRWILSEEGGRASGFDKILARTIEEQTALHIAASRHLECFLPIVNGLRVDNGEREEMLNAVDNKGVTVLHTAALSDRGDVISWILSDRGRGVGFDRVLAETTADKSTALHHAAGWSSSETTRIFLSHCTSEERTNLFLAVDKNGWTVLHHAAHSYKADAIMYLLSYPECAMIVNRKDNLGMTALHRAIIGGLDDDIRRRRLHGGSSNRGAVRALLGFDDTPLLTPTTTAKARIDPNIGLGLL